MKVNNNYEVMHLEKGFLFDVKPVDGNILIPISGDLITYRDCLYVVISRRVNYDLSHIVIWVKDGR